MFLNWIYNSSPFLVTGVAVVAALLISTLGLLLTYRLRDKPTRDAHGELAGFVVTNIAVLYAVLLAFIAIATWESYAKAIDVVQTEANLAANLSRDTVGLPASTAELLRAEVRQYLRVVIAKEWPAQRAGRVPANGWTNLARIHGEIAGMAPKSAGETVLMQEMLRGLNALYDARSSRLGAVDGHVPAMMWFVILALGGLTIAYGWFVKAEGLISHMAMLAGLTVAVTVILVLIVELDYPFRGTISVSTEAYEAVLHQLSAAPHA